MNLTSLTRLALVAVTLVSAALATSLSGYAGSQHEGHKKPPAQDTRPPAEKKKEPAPRPGERQPRSEPARSDQQADHATHDSAAKGSTPEPAAAMPNMGPAAEFLMQQSSGTATNPGSAPMDMKHFSAGPGTSCCMDSHFSPAFSSQDLAAVTSSFRQTGSWGWPSAKSVAEA